MKSPFETWLSEKKFSNNVFQMFTESIACYKNGAYRASLHFSYLSFLTSIKELINRTVKPNNINQEKWDAVINKIQINEAWEKAVFSELTNKHSGIFNISDDIRDQIKYWRDRRNDCAHYRDNEIEAHHTESFWSFLKSNLPKITIEGGKENLLNKFSDHFNPTYKPVNADFSHLVEEIDDTVEQNDLTDFWQQLINRTDIYGFLFHHDNIALKIVNRVFELCCTNTKENLADFLIKRQNDLTVITYYPNSIKNFNYSPKQIREIWRLRIWNDKYNAFSNYATLLDHELIPQDEINEANQFVIDHCTGYRPQDERTHKILKSNGFGDALFQRAIVKDRLQDWYKFVQPRADLLTYYVEKYPLEQETVEVLCDMYTRTKYDHWLGDRVRKLFIDNPEKKAEFHLIANNNHYKIPEEVD
ncbi:hypothetical protein [Mucilaginibacter sp. SG564]|uniref:hypothetical protein n=1 Tax=Mucilaginibacter sp. SG564 TaxID=2587022 RepID=UPI001553DBC4|nr:hypothetical protein [Mucilaginibacter sp. SG564]NOW96132.1 hypothetical protein [Mucilaginibacter sp. SG564]